MNAAELHAKLLSESPILPDGQPYGVVAFGGDIDANALCQQTAALMRQIAAGKQFTNAIEIGAGGGRWTRWLRPHCKSLLCVDRTIASKQHIDKLFLKPPPMHITCPWGTLPTGPGSPLHQAFDLVFSYDTFVHFDRVLIQTYIRSIAQALENGGHFVCHIASDEHKHPDQPTDASANWCYTNDAAFNSWCAASHLQLVNTIRACEGFGSRVCHFVKQAAK